MSGLSGSGSTAIAAKLTQHHYLGYEISHEYVELARDRIDPFTSQQPYIPELHPRPKSKGRPKNGKRKSDANYASLFFFPMVIPLANELDLIARDESEFALTRPGARV